MKKMVNEGETGIIDNARVIGSNKLQDQHSTQENKQDLDQEQQVDVKPSQINLQRIDVTVNTKLENYSGKITGIIYINKENAIATEAEIFLYFGGVSDFPVYKTNADKNGCYSIEDLPPGFYSIKAIYNDSIMTTMYNIKVLPGQNSNQPIYLTESIYHKKKRH
ncbi:carboxypeptidase-like regulatory domain-containing protein [Clostridium akagii]|uniref:carboxypeptidase-like regulatory domain-containing protein n=1 Tax=Clostridium akagii TaxID=91623 RepID=UPI000690E048|nr:carboxypeptidase-like regulatory domain-containing protein [Clostridium akagii]